MEIRKNVHGRGVYATQPYNNGEIIEVCQVLLICRTDTKIIDQTCLYNYYYSWGKNSYQAAIALGNGSLYNHSYSPNAIYKNDIKSNLIRFVAIRDIRLGDEITVNYNGNPDSKKKLWFEVLDMQSDGD